MPNLRFQFIRYVRYRTVICGLQLDLTVPVRDAIETISSDDS